MSAALNKTFQYVAQSLQASLLSTPSPGWGAPDANSAPDAHLSPSLAQFLEALHRCRTRHEERALAEAHLAQVQERLKEGSGATTALVADALVRALACHLVGIQVDFAKIYAIQLAQKGNSLEKKMGYLACCLLLEDSDEETLLLVNTLVKDLGSKNVVEVNIALTAMAHLTPPETAAMVVPLLLDKTAHSKDFIRKKSLVCLQHLLSKVPSVADQVEARVFSCLSDTDPGVVAAAVQASAAICRLRIAQGEHARCLEIAPVLLAIQAQVVGGRLPKDYLRGDVSAPWFQADLLCLVRLILDSAAEPRGAKDLSNSSSLLESADAMLERTVDAADSSHKEPSAQAVLFECVRLAAALERIRPDQQRLTRALTVANSFLRSKHSNVRLAGLESLECLLLNRRTGRGTPFSLTAAQERSVTSCLDHSDDIVQRKALSLLHSLADESSARGICHSLLSSLADDEKGRLDEFRKADLVGKVLDLVDRFGRAGGLEWQVRTLLRLLQCSDEGCQREEVIERVKDCLSGAGEAAEEREEVGWKLTKMLAKKAESSGSRAHAHAHTSVLRLYFWCLAHFHHVGQVREEEEEGTDRHDPASVAEKICSLCREAWAPSKSNQLLLISCLEAIFGLLPSLAGAPPRDATRDFLRHCAKSSCGAVRDLAEEILALLPHRSVLAAATAAREEDQVDDDCTLSYLDHVVVRGIKSGKPNPFSVVDLAVGPSAAARRPKEGAEELKFSSYQQMDDESLSKISDPVSPQELDAEAFAVPAVWSARGRVDKKEEEEPTDFTKSRFPQRQQQK